MPTPAPEWGPERGPSIFVTQTRTREAKKARLLEVEVSVEECLRGPLGRRVEHVQAAFSV